MRPSVAHHTAIYVPPILYAGLIFWLSSQRFPSVRLVYGADWGVHTLLYAGFGCVLWSSFRRAGREERVVFPILLICLAYGLSDEIHQYFVPGRTFEWLDIAADGLGGGLGVLFCRLAGVRGRPARSR